MNTDPIDESLKEIGREERLKFLTEERTVSIPFPAVYYPWWTSFNSVLGKKISRVTDTVPHALEQAIWDHYRRTFNA